ncbi:MAG: cysteine hydrolase [Proteobacteria bacterium]|nr:cysteine hydrolase [Pseudomonadota bacterium]
MFSSIKAHFKITNIFSNLKKTEEKKSALLVIDVQEKYAHPKYGRGNQKTAITANRIASIIPFFREASIPIYAIHYTRSSKKLSDIDFFLFKPSPEKGDKVIRKNKESAFEKNNLKRKLKTKSINNLMVCGFNLAACVHDTILDARKAGFNVQLLTDLCANDENSPQDPLTISYYYAKFKKKDIKLHTSTDVLTELNIQQNSLPRYSNLYNLDYILNNGQNNSTCTTTTNARHPAIM